MTKLTKRDMAGRPRLIDNRTPRDREILICSDTDDPPEWGFGVWDSLAGRWFFGGELDLEAHYDGRFDPDLYWENPTHWAELPALPPRSRQSLH